jgi:hypothetical protein
LKRTDIEAALVDDIVVTKVLPCAVVTSDTSVAVATSYWQMHTNIFKGCHPLDKRVT